MENEENAGKCMEINENPEVCFGGYKTVCRPPFVDPFPREDDGLSTSNG